MNNLKSTVNFESSPLASSQAPNLNATTSMMGGRRRRRKRSKKGGMVVEPETPETPEKDRGSRVAPIIEKVPLEDLIDDEKTIENAEDKEYEDLEKQLGNENKIEEESYKIDINEEKEDDALDKLERGESIDENSGGGTRRRRHRRKTKHNKTQKLSRKTKKTRKYKKSKKTRKSNKKK
jgi:hypothetical protein